MTENPKAAAELTPSNLRLIALSLLERALRHLSLSDDSGMKTMRREPPPLLRLRTEEEEAAEVRALVNRVREDQPSMRVPLLRANGLVQRVLDSTTIEGALDSLGDIRVFTAGLTPRGSTALSSQQVPVFNSQTVGTLIRVETVKAFEPEPDIASALKRDSAELEFVACVMQMCRNYRSSGYREFRPDDELAIEKAYKLLDEGVRLPRNYQGIEHTEKRSVQTYLSFADPGEGHLAVTVRERDLLDGIIVHVEYIDRDNVDNRELVEAYRLPAVRNAARVRLHVGDSAPCTAFIGRPVFEGQNFDLGLLKAGHTMASVCSAMFAQGVADCKVAMDGMTARQCVEFMRVVAGNVVRDPVKQSLSAAFNINSPLTDDLFTRGAARHVDKPTEVASLGIRLVCQGQFNKIAWDGASDERPGKPIIGQLSRVHLFNLVHAAHERGLETYISAGMRPEHMRDAVFIGVGGVGIGTSLHYIAPDETKAIGEIDPEKVRQALRTQKETIATSAGCAAGNLAQLDWIYAKGLLVDSEHRRIRQDLFDGLAQFLAGIDRGDAVAFSESNEITHRLEDLCQRSKTVLSSLRIGHAARRRSLKGAFDDQFADPVIDWAERILVIYQEKAHQSGLDSATVERIKEMLEAGDREGLLRLYPS